ncbi:MAG: M50 family metallopeptidase, partial [Actinomycetota bacterium]|nr:M50 family metallopeptidase [Actinomycetota bacterium]
MPFDPSSSAINLILGAAALFTAIALVRSWRTFWDAKFTASDRRLAMQVGMFLVPPVVVLLHELGHVAAVRMVGARVLAFRYGLFEGSVTVGGRLTPYENWFVALSGNVVSLACGLVMVAAGMVGRRWRTPLRYLLVVAGLIELVFTLVGYPLLSLTSSFGDWVVVYDLRRTPALSWTAAAVHVALLVGLRHWWRRRGRAALFALGLAGDGAVRLAELEAARAASPRDPAAHLALADFYASNGELALARATLDDAVGACGDVPRLH